MKRRKTEPRFVICIRNEDCEDLEPRKVNQVLPDEAGAEDGYLRVIDESGEDYLYPQDYFVPIELPQAAAKALLSAASSSARRRSKMPTPKSARSSCPRATPSA